MSEGRIQNSVKNMVFGFMYQIMTLIMSFVSRTVFIKNTSTALLTKAITRNHTKADLL